MKKKSDLNILIPLAIIIAILTILFFAKPKTNKAAFTSAKATLSNSRLSFKAGVTSGTSGQTLITIDGSGDPDPNTNHLFPKDNVCFTPTNYVGCRDNKTYAVSSAPTSVTFNVSPSLTTTLENTDWATATESGTLAVEVVLANELPSNGDILITIPMADNKDGNDNFPDHGTSNTTNGFDLGGITTGDITVTESCGGTFSVSAVNEGSGTSDHTIEINNSVGACAASSTLTITIGDADKKLINPAPITSGHVQGTADTYVVNVKTRNGSNNTIDESDVLIAPIEAVLLSATVDETLSFRVCGVDTDLSDTGDSCFSTATTICGLASLSAASTAYSVPFGAMTSDTFRTLAQNISVGTNADDGYAVTIQQNDQMGKDGVTCTGNPTDPVTTNCIPDNPGETDGTGGSSMEYNLADDCNAGAINGLCYSLDNESGGTAPTFGVKYDTASGNCARTAFCARQAADQEDGPQTPQNIISYGNPISDSDAFVCWRLSIDAIQPAGYYYNKAKYIATPVF